MTDRAARKFDFLLRLLLCIGIMATVHTTHLRAQAKPENPAQNIADTWQGTLHAGRDLRTVVKISKADAKAPDDVIVIDHAEKPSEN
jgi:hypothetical protein